MEKLPPRERSEESYAKLQKFYEKRYESVPDRVEVDETEARKDPLYSARKVVEDLVRMFSLYAEEWKLSPAEQIYAVELFVMNFCGADDCPLTKEQIERVRGKARKYYEESTKT